MSDKQSFFAKIIIAQIGAFFVSSYLIQQVFLGPTPLVQPHVQAAIRQLPTTAVVVMKNLPQTAIMAYRAVTQRALHAQLPPPWVDKSAPIHPGNQLPPDVPPATSVSAQPG